MPAYRERIYICPAESGRPGWVEEFPFWWDRADFFDRFGDRATDTGHPIYVNYAMLLTGWEAAGWNRACREKVDQNALRSSRTMADALDRMDGLLRAASWVIVESYEWESGLD